MIQLRELETERLLLRHIYEDDAEDFYHNITSSENIARYVTWHAHKSIAETVAFIKYCVDDYENLSCYRWAIELKETGELIGMIDVVSYHEGEPELGYLLAEKHQNCGYMTEACRAVVKYLFEEGFKTLYIEALKDNFASNRVIEKTGFHFVREYQRPQSQSKPQLVDVNAYRINRNYSDQYGEKTEGKIPNERI